MTVRISWIVSLFTVRLVVWGFANTESDTQTNSNIETKLCTGIENLMPVEEAISFPADVGKIYLWCKIQNMDGATISHVWYYKDLEMASIDLSINSVSWRTYSSKTILPYWTGNWMVKIKDSDGNELAVIPFTVGETE